MAALRAARRLRQPSRLSSNGSSPGGAPLSFRTLPDHAGKALQRHQRLAGISPFLQLLDGDVIERLPSGAA